MVDTTAFMFVTGPNVVKTVTHQEITSAELGGARVHGEKSGVAHFVLPNDILCLREVRRLINYLPSNNQQKPPILDLRDPLERIDPALDYLIPVNPNHTYDMKVLIHSILDGAEFMEIQPHFARNIICGLGRLGGQTVGLIANQPAVLAGVLDINASAKAARFVRFCDTFNIPLVCFVDVPGFMPGPEQESGGIIRHGAKLLYAFVEATVPRITVILRKAYGGAYIVMNSKHIGGDINYAWPTAEIAVLGPKGAAEVIYRQEIAAAADPDALLGQKTDHYRKTFANPFLAAKRGYIDDVIFPRTTRQRLIRSCSSWKASGPHGRIANTETYRCKGERRVRKNPDRQPGGDRRAYRPDLRRLGSAAWRSTPKSTPVRSMCRPRTKRSSSACAFGPVLPRQGKDPGSGPRPWMRGHPSRLRLSF